MMMFEKLGRTQTAAYDLFVSVDVRMCRNLHADQRRQFMGRTIMLKWLKWQVSLVIFGTAALSEPVTFEELNVYVLADEKNGIITTQEGFDRMAHSGNPLPDVDFSQMFVAFQHILGSGCSFDLETDVTTTQDILKFHTTLMEYGNCDMGFLGMAVVSLPKIYIDHDIEFTQEVSKARSR